MSAARSAVRCTQWRGYATAGVRACRNARGPTRRRLCRGRSGAQIAMATEDLSREIILDHYQNPRNHGRLEHPTLANRGNNPLCGDEIEISVGIDEQGQIIREIAFTGRGCSISQASASMMTEVVKGQKLDDAEAAVKRFTQRMANREPPPPELEEELDALQGVKKYPARVKCALLPWTTLRETVQLYRRRDPAPPDGHETLVLDCADAP